jgi:hypothetical protein
MTTVLPRRRAMAAFRIPKVGAGGRATERSGTLTGGGKGSGAEPMMGGEGAAECGGDSVMHEKCLAAARCPIWHPDGRAAERSGTLIEGGSGSGAEPVMGGEDAAGCGGDSVTHETCLAPVRLPIWPPGVAGAGSTGDGQGLASGRSSGDLGGAPAAGSTGGGQGLASGRSPRGLGGAPEQRPYAALGAGAPSVGPGTGPGFRLRPQLGNAVGRVSRASWPGWMPFLQAF